MNEMSSRLALIDFLRETLSDEATGWVLFDGGTIVVISASITDPQGYACALLDRYGVVVPGTPLADFDVQSSNDLCWLVTFSNPKIFTFVSGAMARDHIGDKQTYEDVEIGLLGRTIRA